MENDEWLRLPAQGQRCRVTGLYRTSLLEILNERDALTGEKSVLSIERRKEDAKRGIRLINRESLLRHLKRCAESQNGLRWGDHVRNPDHYTVQDVIGDRELFSLFLGTDYLISDEAWEIGCFSSRSGRIQALLGNGTLFKVT